MNRPITAVATIAGVIGIVGTIASIVRAEPSRIVVILGAGLVVAVGVLIAVRRPGHPVAWVLMVSGLLSTTQIDVELLARIGVERQWPTTLVHVLAAAESPTWFAALFLPLTVGLLRFPDGRLAGRFWYWTEVAAISAIGAFVVAGSVVSAATPTAELLADGQPAFTGWQLAVFRASEWLFAVVGLCLIATIVSLVIRWRRSEGAVLEQIRWVLLAGAIAIVAQVAVLAFPAPYWAQDVVAGVRYALIATAVGIAITRYKLYEIDRIVSRTVTYAIVVVLLACVYVGVLTGVASLVPHGYGQAGVAIATLIVALLAAPATQRVRSLVDRRFNRARFDAELIAAGFALQLRDNPDDRAIVTDLMQVVARAVQPASIAIWLTPTAPAAAERGST